MQDAGAPDGERNSKEGIDAPASTGTNRTHRSNTSSRAVNARRSEISYQSLAADERALIRLALNDSLPPLLTASRAIVLDGLGVLRPVLKRRRRTELCDDKLKIVEEDVECVEFDKCEDTTGLCAEHLATAAGLRELTSAVDQQLPSSLRDRWSERDVRKLLRSFFKTVRSQIVTSGYSDDLRSIGHFFALHNRQGLTQADWYAGANIILESGWAKVRRVTSEQLVERPLLDSSYELLEAAFGTSRWATEFVLTAELQRIGFPSAFLEQFQIPNAQIQVRCFEIPSRKQAPVWLFATDGLRNARPRDSRAPKHLGYELTLQLPSSLAETPRELGTWTLGALACGSLLALGESKDVLKSNAALSLHRPLFALGSSTSIEPSAVYVDETHDSRAKSLPDHCQLRAIMLTPFEPARLPQRSLEGDFVFANILGITEDEAELVSRLGKTHTLAIFSHRGGYQITNPARNSVLSKSLMQIGRKIIAPAPLARHSATPQSQPMVA